MSALKRKIEQAFVNYLKSQAEFSSINVFEGSAANEPETPFLYIHASQENNNDDMPFESGMRTVDLVVNYQANANDSARSDVDQVISNLSCYLESLETIQGFVNKSVDPDTRIVQGVHVYYITLTSHQSDLKDDMYIEEMIFEIVCGEHTPVI